MLTHKPYEPKQFTLGTLGGISPQQVEQHLEIYRGHVRALNQLNELLHGMTERHRLEGADFGALKQRLGFEYGGMVLHEYYFESLSSRPSLISDADELAEALRDSFGSIDGWRSDFIATTRVHDAGWVVVLQDPVDGRLVNQWITLHDQGVIAGFKPILALDLWEHAYSVDYRPGDRDRYVEAFLSNIDWRVTEERLD